MLRGRVPRVVYGAVDPKAGAAGSVMDVLRHRAQPPGQRGGGRVGDVAPTVVAEGTMILDQRTNNVASVSSWGDLYREPDGDKLGGSSCRTSVIRACASSRP